VTLPILLMTVHIRVKGYAPPSLAEHVEQRLLGEIAAQRGITGVALLDGDGFVLFTEPQHDDSVQNLGKAIALLDPKFSSGRVTLNGEKGTVLVQELLGQKVLVLRCEVSSNLGRIRQVLDTATSQLNALQP
jgi:predicted regulator of Ras-like GTPase activity (Roadblock/LC7/MglB family)